MADPTKPQLDQFARAAAYLQLQQVCREKMAVKVMAFEAYLREGWYVDKSGDFFVAVPFSAEPRAMYKARMVASWMIYSHARDRLRGH